MPVVGLREDYQVVYGNNVSVRVGEQLFQSAGVAAARMEVWVCVCLE